MNPSYTTSPTRPSFPSGSIPSSPQTSELASWVNQVRQRNQSITSNHSTLSPSSPTPYRAATATTSTATGLSISNASELELDFQRQRQERQSRRNRLSTSGVRGIADSPLSSPATEFPPPSQSQTHYSGYVGMAGGPSSQHPPSDRALPSASPSGASPSNVRRAHSLLSRYGGQYGPTGIAAGPKSPGDAPVSLANFMGGKAAGPRLGKLVGDGKGAPPEASEIHENRWVALPGLASGERPGAAGGVGARPLASFLEERANASGIAAKRMSVPVASKATGAAEMPFTSSASPAKYSSYLSRSRSNSYRTEKEDVVMAPSSPSIGLSTSPRKAYIDLVEKQNAHSAPIAQRPPSPSKPWERPSTATTPDENARPRSPFKPSTTPFGGHASSSPTKVSPSVQIPTSSNRLGLSREGSFTSARKDAATSPLKLEDVPFVKTVAASSALGSGRTTSSWKPPTLPTEGQNKFGASHPTSPTLQDTQKSGSFPQPALTPSDSSLSNDQAGAAVDRTPTASLTRLSAKKMVGQRIREAQERDSQAQRETDSIAVGEVGSGLSKYGGSAYGASGVRDRWPAGAGGVANVSTPSYEEKKRVGGWSPSKFGNALPGLAGRSPPKSLSAAGIASSPSKRHADDDADIRAAPVRLPGMGAEASPFKRFGASTSSPTKEEQIDLGRKSEVLEPLTKGRVRGPARRAATGPASSTAKSPQPISVSTNKISTLDREASSPKKVTSGFGAPASPSRTQALASRFGGASGAAAPSSPTKVASAVATGQRSPTKSAFPFSATAPPPSSSWALAADRKTSMEAASEAAAPLKPLRRTRGKRIHVLVSGSGSNLQSLIDATLVNPPSGIPVIPDAQITFVLSNRKAAYGLTRASESNPPIPTKVLALKTWQNRNPGGTREEYDQVLARAVLDGPAEEGRGSPPDLIVLAGFMHIVSEGFLHALGHKTSLPASTPTISSRPSKPVPIINLHPALPGAFDGANAIPRAFEAYQQGLTDRTGCMVHEVVADVDRGRPLIVREVVIQRGWDLAKLEEEIHKIEHVIIVNGARQVLEGRLEDMDREEEARRREQAQSQQRSASPAKEPRVQGRAFDQRAESRDVESGASVAFKAEQALKASSFDPQAVLAFAGSSVPSAGVTRPKTVSVEVISIGADGSTNAIDSPRSGQRNLSDGAVLYEDETLAVVHRFKAASGLMENQVWIRLGLRSPLHPVQRATSLDDSGGEELKRAEELARRYGTTPNFVPAGFEDADLIASLGGRWTVARQGTRSRFETSGTALYRVRSPAGASAATTQLTTICQVDLTTSNLCSSDSFVASILGSSLVWHGHGCHGTTREAARLFAQALQQESGDASTSQVSENEEGREDAFFWDLFDRSKPYASAYYHRLPVPSTPSLAPPDVQLFDIGLERGTLTLHPAIEPGRFGQMDLLSPLRQREVSLLNLSNRELFLVIGEGARDARVKILAGCMVLDRLASYLETQRGNETGRPAAHVLVLPSKVPREIRAAARYWTDSLPLQREAGLMNVRTTREAAKEVLVDRWQRERLLDPTWLPVGVAAEDLGAVV